MRAVLLFFLGLYRKAVSPSLGQNCRYYPSCSAYAEEAVRVHGSVKGGALAAARLVRCNPWSKGGVDLVPGSPMELKLLAERGV